MRTVLLASCIVFLAGCASAHSTQSQHTAVKSFQATVQYTRLDTHTRIAWYSRGTGPKLIMLMGTGSTMSEWDPALLQLLARHHQLIMIDYPGIGLSTPKTLQRTSFRSLADIIDKLIVRNGWQGSDALGWSMGGFVAQNLITHHGEHIGSVVLAGTNGGGDSATLGSAAVQQIDSDPDASDREILHELYPPNKQAEGRRFLRRLETASAAGVIPDDWRVPAATVNAQVNAEDSWLRSNANANALQQTTTRVLVTGGRNDEAVPPANIVALHDLIPHAAMRLFPGAHAFLFQSRVAFTAAVNRFLQ